MARRVAPSTVKVWPSVRGRISASVSPAGRGCGGARLVAGGVGEGRDEEGYL